MRTQLRQNYYGFLLLAACVALYVLWWRSASANTTTETSEPPPYYPLNICEIAIGITTTASYKDRTQMQEKTWIKEMCSKESNYRYITDEKSDNNTYIFSSCPNDYNSVCCKTADLVHTIYALLPQMKWFMKCDDDSYVVPERLVDYLSSLDPQEPILAGMPYYVVLDNMCTVPRTRHNCTAGSRRPHIGGALGYTKEDNFAYPAGGPCYAFSNELARRMVDYNVTQHYSKYCNSKAPFEDLMISRIAHDVGGYVVDGSQYFDEYPPATNRVKTDTKCCYHMYDKSWKKMDQVHEALHPN